MALFATIKLSVFSDQKIKKLHEVCGLKGIRNY